MKGDQRWCCVDPHTGCCSILTCKCTIFRAFWYKLALDILTACSCSICTWEMQFYCDTTWFSRKWMWFPWTTERMVFPGKKWATYEMLTVKLPISLRLVGNYVYWIVNGGRLNGLNLWEGTTEVQHFQFFFVWNVSANGAVIQILWSHLKSIILFALSSTWLTYTLTARPVQLAHLKTVVLTWFNVVET